jgi:hypothetical protein
MRPWGLVLAVLLVAAGVAVVLAVWGSSNGPDQGSASPTPRPTVMAEPEYDYPATDNVDTCFNPINDRDDAALLAMQVVDCDAPHLAELIGTPELDARPNAAWPGQAAIDREAENLCLDIFEDYVGVPFETSRLDASYISTSEALWLGGDRLVICFVETSSAAPFMDSVRDLGQ